jgi:hypothetical protein
LNALAPKLANKKKAFGAKQKKTKIKRSNLEKKKEQ